MTTPKRKRKVVAKPATGPVCASQCAQDLTPLQIAIRTADPWRVANELQNQGMNELAEFLYGLDFILDHVDDEHEELETRMDEQAEEMGKEIKELEKEVEERRIEADDKHYKLGEALMKIQDLETKLALLG
jgi:predicted RNase H-like nuclease (RuvC/YqgF family)